MIRFSLGMLLLIVGFGPSTAFSADGANKSASIGVILPLSGDAAFWGDNSKRGIEMAQQDLTAQRSTALNFSFEDDQCDPKRAVSAFHKLVDQSSMQIILGSACSSASLAMAPLAQRKKVLLITFSEADTISQAGSYVFRLWVPNGRLGKTIARTLYSESKLRTIGILAIQNAYGDDLARNFQNEFETLGGKVAAREDYAPDIRDFRPQLLRLQGANAAAILFASYIADGAAAVRQARSLGMSQPFIGSSTLNSGDFFSAAGAASDGMVIFDVPDETNAQFRARYERQYSAPWPGMQSGASIFYDFTKFLAAAVEEVGPDAERLREYFAADKRYSGVTGTVSFDHERSLSWTHVPWVVRRGKMERQ